MARKKLLRKVTELLTNMLNYIENVVVCMCAILGLIIFAFFPIIVWGLLIGLATLIIKLVWFL